MEELKQRILAEGRGKAEGGVVMVGYLMGLPVVFVKKKNPKTVEESWKSWVWSFTRGDETTVCVDRQFLRDHNIPYHALATITRINEDGSMDLQ